jgi:hypothetical protein
VLALFAVIVYTTSVHCLLLSMITLCLYDDTGKVVRARSFVPDSLGQRLVIFSCTQHRRVVRKCIDGAT